MKKFKLDIAFFQSKVARRVTSLFLLSALVPLITTAFLSKTYITNLLIDQGYSNLHNEGKFYVMSLFDRLSFVEMRLRNIANEINNSQRKKLNLKTLYGNEFTSLVIEKISKTALIRKSDIVNKKAVSINSVITSSGKPKIYMSLQLKQINKSTVTRLTAEINPVFLWGTAVSLQPEYTICVINEGGGVLYCSKPVPQTITLNNTKKKASDKIKRWTSVDGDYISASKMLFLKSKYDSTNWKVIATQLEKDVLTPASTFNKLFPLVIILTLLVVLLLSISQIQRILVPLKKLISGTQHVANREFNEKVDVSSNDEFSDLALSFNTMSERLKRQFATFIILADIDKLILSNPDSEEIYQAVLKHIQDVAPCDIASITVLEDDAPNIGKTFLSQNAAAVGSQNKRITLSDEDIKTLLSPTATTDMLAKADEHHFLGPVKEYGATTVCVFPVSVNDSLAAIISLGSLAESSLTDEDIQQVRDIADRVAVALSSVERDKLLYHQSHYDNLTNLPNRQLIGMRLDQEIKHCWRVDSSLAILFLDLDHFKKVNDTLGHAIGDELLQQVAERLTSCVRETDTVARLGGDEFTIMLTGSLDSHDISDIAENIIQSIEKPFIINTHEIFISTSIGISVFPTDGMSGTELFKNADTAMYRVKELGRGKHLFFEEKMNIKEMERANLERDMRHALDRNEFVLHYQPLVDIKSGDIIGAEALIRWHHPTRGLIPSSKFIELAEETGTIEQIGEWVLHSACLQLKEWSENNILLDRMAVNVSSRQFIQRDFEQRVSMILDETEVPAEKLDLEITETLLMDERIDSIKILDNLNKRKIHLSIDDFGTGFSSLSYLKRFPVNTLKIDRSFMQDVTTDEDAMSIVKSIITLAHTLNLTVIAEGIETAEQLSILNENKCDFAQGYYFSEPLTAIDFEDFYLKKNNILKFKH